MSAIVQNWCADYEPGGPWENESLVAAGKILDQLVDCAIRVDETGGKQIVDALVLNPNRVPVACVLAVASGILAHFERQGLIIS